jgi:hypothetical protein
MWRARQTADQTPASASLAAIKSYKENRQIEKDFAEFDVQRSRSKSPDHVAHVGARQRG